eukprot:TRINITY_DN196_c0_g1_i2.p1 TRINITY_DN196_c0_g1~~TRINITY_DN196_c0_g1_i2.p1  ORF type:complete len:162 (+),score=36.57 TRINITY_DN196_c0_g1_i2:213-698(+)
MQSTISSRKTAQEPPPLSIYTITHLSSYHISNTMFSLARTAAIRFPLARVATLRTTSVLSSNSIITLQPRRFYAADHHALAESEISERVLSVIRNFDKVEAKKVSPTATFRNDLGLDSLDAVEIVMAIEEEFNIEIPEDDADKIQSCNDAIEYIKRNPSAK